LIATYVASLGLGYGRDNGWLVEADGSRRPIEYVGVRAAGDLVRAGQPAAAYDWPAHQRAHDAVIGKPTRFYYAWPYPPTYLPVAEALAALPYVASALLLLATTLAVFACAAVRITGSRAGALPALAAPPTMINAAVVHTGFLIGGLMGLGLALLRRRPLCAGLCFGLVSIKPQLGLLLPIALAAGGHWRSIAATVATIAAMVAASLALYGVEPWLAFPPQLARVADDIFRAGEINFAMVVTVYGLARFLGVGHDPALIVQGVVTVFLALAVFQLWRSAVCADLKAAGLVVASLLATPYLFTYDLTLLTVALLFFVRHVGTVSLERVEIGAILVGGVLLLLASALPFPVGVVANALAAALVWRRAMLARQLAPVPA
jgi:hypothetical protein